MKFNFVNDNINIKNLDIIKNNNLNDCDDWLDKFLNIVDSTFLNIKKEGKTQVGIDISSFETKKKNRTYIYSELNEYLAELNKKDESLDDFSFYFINFVKSSESNHSNYDNIFKNLGLGLNLGPEDFGSGTNSNNDKKYPKKVTRNLASEKDKKLKNEIKEELKYTYNDKDIFYENDDKIKLYYQVATSMPAGRKSHTEIKTYNKDESEMKSFDVMFDKIKKENSGNAFATCLYEFLDKKNLSNVEFYQRAGISKSLFSKMQTDIPSRSTVASSALGLELNLEETKKLYQSAGYYFNLSNDIDIIIYLCISAKRYDLNWANNWLIHRHVLPLGSTSREVRKQLKGGIEKEEER